MIISIFQLSSPIHFSYRIKPIKLATRDNYIGSEGIVTGWGNLNQNRTISNYPNILQKFNTRIYSNKFCRRDYTQICTLAIGGSGTCGVSIS